MKLVFFKLSKNDRLESLAVKDQLRCGWQFCSMALTLVLHGCQAMDFVARGLTIVPYGFKKKFLLLWFDNVLVPLSNFSVSTFLFTMFGFWGQKDILNCRFKLMRKFTKLSLSWTSAPSSRSSTQHNTHLTRHTTEQHTN